MARLYVGNLPYPVRDKELREYFENAGCTVMEAVVPLTSDDRSKGFGFVEVDEASKDKALSLDGQDMNGRPLRVNEARPREDRGGAGASRPAQAEAGADNETE